MKYWPIYIVIYCIEWVTTSWTYSMSMKIWPILYSKLPYKMGHYFMDTQYSPVLGKVWSNLLWAAVSEPCPVRRRLRPAIYLLKAVQCAGANTNCWTFSYKKVHTLCKKNMTWYLERKTNLYPLSHMGFWSQIWGRKRLKKVKTGNRFLWLSYKNWSLGLVSGPFKVKELENSWGWREDKKITGCQRSVVQFL